MDPFPAEVLACQDAMLLAMGKALPHVIIETDCKNICTMWEQGDDRSAAESVFTEMRTYLLHFQGFKLAFVLTKANGAAHVCAKHFNFSLRFVYF